MAINRKLTTDRDFEEAAAHRTRLRVFKDDHLVESGSIIVRFDETTIVLQSDVSDLTYYARSECEFFELRRG